MSSRNRQGLHVTVLSNFARGFDKYTRRYSKARISQSTYPDEFYLLEATELAVGVDKARKLLEKLAIEADELLILQTSVAEGELYQNLRTGLGRWVARSWIRIDSLALLHGDGRQEQISIEDAFARSIRLLTRHGHCFNELRPRSVSVLPIAKGCQAKCSFCFSDASVSFDQHNGVLAEDRVATVLAKSRQMGAVRAVITGGGEPTLLPRPQLLQLVQQASEQFQKVVLITNGYALSQAPAADRVAELLQLQEAGLTTLCVSRHHHDAASNAAIMGLEIASEGLAESWRLHCQAAAELPSLQLRWICVLQKGGVEDRQTLEQYLAWAAASGVSEVCFKELYVASSAESVYYDLPSNHWSRDRQVPLSLVVELAEQEGWPVITRLPWGAPVFRIERDGVALRVAAYTEPSLGWELAEGVARSFNLMADGTCLASLEDRASEVLHPCR